LNFRQFDRDQFSGNHANNFFFNRYGYQQQPQHYSQFNQRFNHGLYNNFNSPNQYSVTPYSQNYYSRSYPQYSRYEFYPNNQFGQNQFNHQSQFNHPNSRFFGNNRPDVSVVLA